MSETTRSDVAGPSSIKRVLARLGVLVTLLLALSAGTSVPVSASPYPPSSAVLDLSDRNLPPSTSFVATVAGCLPGETVTFFVDGVDPVTVVCGPDGVATTTLTSPSTPGTYDVTAVLGTTGITLIDSVTVTVTAVAAPTTTNPATGPPAGQPANPATPDTSLPRTGSGGVATTLLIGGGLVLFGAAFAFVARGRRRAINAA